jgi:hypothetical protein
MYPESWSGTPFKKRQAIHNFHISRINQGYYIEHVLENHLTENVKNLHGELYFQQDSAPFHKAKRTPE